MAGADVFAQFMPNMRDAESYVRDPALQAQIMQQIAQAQQDRIRQMGETQAQVAGNVGNGLVNALGAYKSGREFAAEEALNKSRLAQMAAQTGETQATTNQTNTNTAHQQFENKNAEAFESAKGPNGQTNYERQREIPLNAAEAQTQATQSATANAKAITASTIASNAQRNRLEALAAGDSHKLAGIGQFEAAAKGLGSMPEGPARDKAMQALAAKMGKQYGIDPNALAAAGSTFATQASLDITHQKAINDTALQSTPAATQASQYAQTFTQKSQLYRNIKTNLDKYHSGYLNGTGIDNQAIQSIQQDLIKAGMPQMADEIASVGLMGREASIKEALQLLKNNIQNDAAQQALTLPPEAKNLPVVKTTQALVQNLDDPTISTDANTNPMNDPVNQALAAGLKNYVNPQNAAAGGVVPQPPTAVAAPQPSAPSPPPYQPYGALPRMGQ